MIVYVESNFVLELAYVQEEHDSCEHILSLSQERKVVLAIPAFCLGEPYESWTRRSRQRRELHDRLVQEIGEISRSKPYVELLKNYQTITKTLIRSGEEEKQRLDNVISLVIDAATIIPIERDIIKAAIRLQAERSLAAQDALVYSSVLSHMAGAPSEAKCFLTKNSKDFANPDVYNDLNTHTCRLLTKFSDGLGYIQSTLLSSS